MEDEDDDFYGGPAPSAQDFAPDDEEPEQKMEVAGEEEDEEEEDSDDDVQFTLEKPKGDKADSSAQPRPAKQPRLSVDRTTSTEIKQAQGTTPVKQEQQRSVSTQPAATIKGTLAHNGKEGKDFPEYRSSKIDVNEIPTWPANGKPITAVDIDADLAEHSKPWRLPGTDQTDFFNYGFDEYTWAQYCIRQQTMSGNIADQKQADAQMKAMFGGGGGAGGPGGGGMPTGMPPMPGMSGMPSPEDMMQQMMASGMNPNDPNAFMQMMMGGGGGMPGGGAPNQQGGGGGFGQQGGGFGGSGQNSVSPNPQAGQGFQPPSGPSAQNQHGDQGGFNVEGYSPQQLAIMQQQGGAGQGGRGRGRGRGRYY